MLLLPAGEALDYMIQQALDPNATTEGGEAAKPTLLGQLASTVKSLNAFMRALK